MKGLVELPDSLCETLEPRAVRFDQPVVASKKTNDNRIDVRAFKPIEVKRRQVGREQAGRQDFPGGSRGRSGRVYTVTIA